MSKVIGIVVAGIGRAGRARVRDITEKVIGENVAELRGVISRHKPEEIEVPFLSWEEALNRSDVDAVIIATENDTHEEYARKCIEAGKHVLVEFPLAISFGAARDLIALAEEKGLVLQEEDIGLLLSSYKELYKTLNSKPPMTETRMNFSGRFSNKWVGDLKRAGFPSFSGLSRVHMLYELFGELTVSEAKLTHEDDRILMVTTLLTNDKRPIIWTEDRGQDFARSFNMEINFEDGSVIIYPPAPAETVPPSHPTASSGPPSGSGAPPAGTGGPPRGPPRGLFAEDLKMFLSKLRGEVGAEDLAKEKKRVLYCLELAGKIEEMASTKV